jgi:hypothetical protein
MKLAVKYIDGSPVGAKPNRIVLGTFDFVQSGTAPLSNHDVHRVTVPIDDKSWIAVEASYTPANKVLSIISAYRTKQDEVHVFSTTTEFQSVPTYFCFRLPTGHYIELYV